jgi:hypothetical protein
MVGGAVDPPARARHAPQRLGERAPVGHEQREVEEPARTACARRRAGFGDELHERRPAGAEPHGRVGALGRVGERPQPDDALVERRGAGEVRDGEPDRPEGDGGGQGGHRMHAQLYVQAQVFINPPRPLTLL